MKPPKNRSANLATPEKVAALHDHLDKGRELLASHPEERYLRVSNGNQKLNSLKSVSFLPVITCARACPYCYAMTGRFVFDNVRIPEAINTALYLDYKDVFASDLDRVARLNVYLRHFVAGDMPDDEYLPILADVASRNPGCHHHVFTKRCNFVNDFISANRASTDAAIPNNVHILLSGDNEHKPVNPYNLPETLVIKPGMQPPAGAAFCSGNCEECFCAGIGCGTARPGQVICFNQH